MKKVKNNKGFTMIELVIVIAIIAIISAITIPSYSMIVGKSKARVCTINRSELLKRYNEYLAMKGFGHSDAVFNQFLHDYGHKICPEGGAIQFVSGNIKCSIHTTTPVTTP